MFLRKSVAILILFDHTSPPRMTPTRRVASYLTSLLGVLLALMQSWTLIQHVRPLLSEWLAPGWCHFLIGFSVMSLLVWGQRLRRPPPPSLEVDAVG